MRLGAPAMLALVVAIGLLAAPALAQLPQDGSSPPPPPELKEADDPPILMSYFVMAVLIALACGANAIPSKRGHQD